MWRLISYQISGGILLSVEKSWISNNTDLEVSDKKILWNEKNITLRPVDRNTTVGRKATVIY